MKKEKWKTFVTDRWKVAAPGLLAAFAVCFIFFIYAPLELYVTNQTEFWFDFYKILKAVLQNFALFFGLNVLGILLAACISKVFCRFVTAAELVVLLTLYVQGNFLVNHMPPFDGTEIVCGLRATVYCGSFSRTISAGRPKAAAGMRIFLPCPAETRGVISPLSASSNSFKAKRTFSNEPGTRNSINSPPLI